MTTNSRDDSGQREVVKEGAKYVVATLCPECCFAKPSFDEWLKDGSKRNLARVDVTGPSNVCRDCRTQLPPGSTAWERWTCIFDPDADAAYWDEASYWAEEILMRDDEQREDFGPAPQGRFILCPWCHRLAGPENDGDVIRHGLVTLPDTSCSTCKKPLPLGTPAIAMTFYGDSEHHEPWEHHHLQLLPEAPRRGPLLRFLDTCLRLLNRLRITLAQILHTRPSPCV